MSRDQNISQVDFPSEINKNIFGKRKSSKAQSKLDLDDVLTTELGQFGWFQLRNILLLAIPIAMSAFMSEYVFSAAAVQHRCRISECGEDGKFYPYEPDWLQDAVPRTSSGYSSCERYVSANIKTNSSLDYCPSYLFDQRKTVGCDGFVYAKDNSVVSEFDLGCQDFLRAFVGTLHSIGMLPGLPITGYISDNYGRKWALIISVFNVGLFGLIRAFSVNYIMYIVLQLLQTTLGAGTFSSAYIFATELVGPKYRVVASATLFSIYAVGQVILGGVAWLIQPWRFMIMALHIPCLLFVSYYWFLPESIRWLLSKKKYTEVKTVLEKVARVNKTFITEKSIETLMLTSTETVQASDVDNSNLLKKIISSSILLRRVFTIPIWWITTTFVYHGLSINSTSLSDSMYLNYILTVTIEIPGYFTAVLILDRLGRKITIATGFFFSAACNIAFVFIPSHVYLLRLIIYLFGKFGISAVMMSLYLFTSELYPTEYRHSLLAFSSMIGRIGSITAPLTPMNYWHGIPSMMFAMMGILSGILVLTQPETLGVKMPDTLAEAEALGKQTEK